MFLSRRIAWYVCALAALWAGSLAAAPVQFDVTPTFTAPSGIVDGYRAYLECDLSAQTKGALIGPASSGQVFSFQGDSAQTYEVCVVAFNSAGEGGFATIGTITATLMPPGDVSTTYTIVCSLNPATGGTCSVE